MNRITSGLLVVSLAAVLASGGCGKGGAKSPEDAFKAATEAVKKEDMKTFASHLTTDSQSAMSGTFVMVLGMTREMAKVFGKGDDPKLKDIDDLLKRHGLTDEAVSDKMKGMKEAGGDKKAGVKAMIALGGLVKDKGAFMDDVIKTMKKVEGKDDNPLKEMGEATLKDVKVTGDTATGTRTSKGKTETTHFRKEGGAWKIDLIPQLEEKGLGGLD